MKKVYQFYSDAGHGWLCVKRAELNRLGIGSKVSSFSYQSGDWVYLEEDCDATLFHRAKQARGEEYETMTRYSERSRIREKERYAK